MGIEKFMKRGLIAFILFFAGLLCYSAGYEYGSTKKPVEKLFVIPEEQDIEEIDPWDIFLEAIIWVESKGDSLAVGTANDVGILQITPIYVAECNRLKGYKCWTLEDRKSPTKSLEMFEWINSHKNPDKDIALAIKIHNPGAGKWYADRIYDKMNEIII